MRLPLDNSHWRTELKEASKWFGAVALAVAAVGSANAAPVDFKVTNSSFTAGSGYGGGSFDLDAVFSANGALNVFSLANGQSMSFTFGTVTLNETDVGLFETDNLGVSANFNFDSPLDAMKSVSASGTAVIGPVSDSGTDFTLDWSDVTVTVGSVLFKISMDDLVFKGTGSQTQKATITLISGGTPTPSGAVPEPASLALVGGALALMGGLRRRRKAA